MTKDMRTQFTKFMVAMEEAVTRDDQPALAQLRKTNVKHMVEEGERRGLLAVDSLQDAERIFDKVVASIKQQNEMFHRPRKPTVLH